MKINQKTLWNNKYIFQVKNYRRLSPLNNFLNIFVLDEKILQKEVHAALHLAVDQLNHLEML